MITEKEEEEIRKDEREKVGGKGMICNRGRGTDERCERLYPDCTWKGGAECSGLKKHKYDSNCGKWFCMRAGVWRQCVPA